MKTLPISALFEFGDGQSFVAKNYQQDEPHHPLTASVPVQTFCSARKFSYLKVTIEPVIGIDKNAPSHIEKSSIRPFGDFVETVCQEPAAAQ
jgi:hypothetical protein